MNIYITRKGKEKLIQQYDEVDKKYIEITKAMGISDSLDNDLRENVEFMELRVKAMYILPKEKGELKERLENSIVIENTKEYINFDGVTVIMGSEVILNIDGEEEKYVIKGTDEGDITKNIIAENAPITRAILGHKVGDTVNFNNMIIKIKSVKKFEEL